jgi:hypothetical protein
MKIFKQIDIYFIFQPQKPKVQSFFFNQQKLKTRIQLNIIFIKTLIRTLRSIRSILVYKVNKSKDYNKNGEVLSISNIK